MVATTQQQIDALKNAVASGAKVVRYADGKTVEYHSLREMLDAIERLSAQADAEASATPKPVYRRIAFSNGRAC